MNHPPQPPSSEPKTGPKAKPGCRPVVEVSAGIIVRNGTVLLARRSSGQNMAGYWEFPGGKREGDETPAECLEREIMEELGLGIRAGELISDTIFPARGRDIRLMGILAECLEGEIRLRVHDAATWVRPDEISAYRLAPADLPIAAEIRRRAGAGIAPFSFFQDRSNSG